MPMRKRVVTVTTTQHHFEKRVYCPRKLFVTMSYDNPITNIMRSLMMKQLDGLDERMEDRVAV